MVTERERLQIADCRLQIGTWSLILATCFCALALGADYDGGTAGMFLNYGASPRSLAMGKAFTGLANDVEACYFNPAGLVQLNAQNIKLAHSTLYGGCRMEYIAYGLPSRQYGTFGLTVLNFGAERIDSRDANNNRYKTSVYSENAVAFSYAYGLWNWLGVGATMKLITKNLAEFGGVAIGADVGAIFLGLRPFQFGIVAANLLPPRMEINPGVTRPKSDIYPTTFRVGTALRLYRDRAALTFDLVKIGYDTAHTIRPHGGIEFQVVQDVLVSRIGLDMNELSVGVGLKKTWGNAALGVDYAFLLHHQSQYMLRPTHKLGLNIEYGGFRTWIDAMPKVFSPTPDDKNNVLWMDVKFMTRRRIKRWQILVKNSLGEVVRTYAGWDMPPLRFAWDGLDDAGRLVGDGRYFYDIVLVDERNEGMDHSGSLVTIRTRGPQGRIDVEPRK